MKRKIKFLSVLAGFSAILVLTGCNKFLDETDPSNFTVPSYFTKPEHAQSAVNSIYLNMREPLVSGFGGGAWMMLEFATGLAGTDLGQAVNSYFVKDLVNTSDNGYGLNLWTNYYRGIANANLAIQKIPEIPGMDEGERKRLIGEAHFLRAWYYFNLVQTFGKIPLITEPVDNLNHEQLKPTQAAVEEVYNLIVQDLQTAEQAGLPMRGGGRAGLGAVKTLLAKVYLTMAGYPLQKGASHYTLAAQKAKEVIDAGEFSLFASYNDLHTPARKNTGEFIFMVEYLEGAINNSVQVAILPYNKNISRYSDETGGIYATTAFAESFDPDDLRGKEKEFFFTEFSHQDDRNLSVDLGGYFIYKLFDVNAHLNTAASGLNFSLLRYADVLLMYAEASNEVNGPTADAYAAVNAVRSRAELPALAGLSEAQFREAVWKERWYELCFENITWFDMVRLRKAFNVNTKQFDNYVGHQFSYGPVLKERELLFPIPTAELLNNDNLEQNLGY